MLEQISIGIVASVVTIAAAGISAIRYLGRAGVIEEAAKRLDVDLYELSGGLETALEREPPMKVMRAIEELANDDDSMFEPEMLVTSAGNVAAPSTLIENALLGEDVNRVQLLGRHLSDEELSDLLDARNLWPDPVETVALMEDDPSHAYAWILTEEATEEDRQSLAREIEETFIGMKASEPEALHFIVREVEELRELDSETVESYVKPWLKESSNQSEENR